MNIYVVEVDSLCKRRILKEEIVGKGKAHYVECQCIMRIRFLKIYLLYHPLSYTIHTYMSVCIKCI